jgi:hypothetical protein
MSITRDEIESRFKRRTAVLPVPGIGDIRVQVPSETDRATYESDWFDSNGVFLRDRYKLRRPHLIVLTMLKPDSDELMWSANDRDFVAHLGHDFVGPVFEAIEDYCGLKEKQEANRDAEKKSEEASVSSS